MFQLFSSDLESEEGDGDESDGGEEDESVEVNAPPTKKKKNKSDISNSSSQPYAHIPFTFTSKNYFMQTDDSRFNLAKNKLIK